MVSVTDDPRLQAAAAAHPYPLVFATLSGAHLYGFPSPDSDFDLRGIHLLPAAEVVGLEAPRETIELAERRDDFELDLVTHDLKKFCGLMLRRNGYVLEQLYSPLVVHTSPAHDELIRLGRGCITRLHAHHYLGFANTQWRLFGKEAPPRVKPLLYVFRVLLTGIHLMRSGEVEANLLALNDEYRLPYVPELVARKLAGPERAVLTAGDVDQYEREYQRLCQILEEEAAASALPEQPVSRAGLNALLVELRLGGPR